MIGSSLVTLRMQAYAGNYTKNRARYGKITEICIHHCADIITVAALGSLWQRVGRKGSSHYGVSGTQIGQYVSEDDIAWTNGGANSPHGWDANCRSVTIETSNSGRAPNWPVADDTLATLIKLVADIAKRNNIGALVVGKTLTYHSMYAATACPGPYLKGKLQYICDEANRLNNSQTNTNESEENDMQFLHAVSEKCEVFSAADVNAVFKGYNGGKLRKGVHYPIHALLGEGGGFSWARIFVDGEKRYAVILPDRSEVVSLSSGDAFAACAAQAGVQAADPELAKKLAAETLRADTAEKQAKEEAAKRVAAEKATAAANKQAGEYLVRINNAKSALGA